MLRIKVEHEKVKTGGNYSRDYIVKGIEVESYGVFDSVLRELLHVLEHLHELLDQK